MHVYGTDEKIYFLLQLTSITPQMLSLMLEKQVVPTEVLSKEQFLESVVLCSDKFTSVRANPYIFISLRI